MSNEHSIEHGIGVKSLQEFMQANPGHEIYDFSSLELADQCLRKYSYKYIDHVDSSELASPSAEFSKCIIHPMAVDFFRMETHDFTSVTRTGEYWRPLFEAWARTTHANLTPKYQAAYTIDAAQIAARNLMDQVGTERLRYHYLSHEQVYWRVLPDLDNAIWVAKPDVMLTRDLDGAEISVEVKQSLYPFNAQLNNFDRQLLSQAWVTGVPAQLRLFMQFCVRPASRSSTHFGLDGVDVYFSHNDFDTGLMQEWLAETQFSVETIQRAKKSGIWTKRAPRACNDFNHQCIWLSNGGCAMGPVRSFLIEGMNKINPLEYLGL
jgi:hypothetical protein